MMKQVYLDNAGSTKVLPEIKDTLIEVMDKYYANPSAIHTLGNDSKLLFKEARKQIASLCLVKEEEVFFTSGASESINTAIKGSTFYHMKRGKHIITTSVEHPATTSTVKYLEERFGFEVTYIKPVNGVITAQMVMDELRDDTILVSMIYVQSETGIINPVIELGKLLHDTNVIFHVDACQGFGKIKFSMEYMDLVSVSFHKLHGIKGSGILIKKDNVHLDNLIHGGGQQSIRSGTIPLELVVCGAKTARLALESIEPTFEHASKLWNILNDSLSTREDVYVTSKPGNSPFIFNFSMRDINISALVRVMWDQGFYFASRTSCASSTDYSPVLFDICNDKEVATNSMRISLCKFVTEDEIRAFLKDFDVAVLKVRSNDCG